MEKKKENNKKEKDISRNVKEFFLFHFKDKKNYTERKYQNIHLNKMLNIINNGITLLNETEITKGIYEIKRKYYLKNNLTINTYKNSRNNMVSPLKEMKKYQNRFTKKYSMTISPNTKRTNKYFFIKNDSIKKKLFSLGNRKNKRITSSEPKHVSSTIANKYYNNNIISKDSKNIPKFKLKDMNDNRIYSIDKYNDFNIRVKLNNSNKSSKSHRIMSSNINEEYLDSLYKDIIKGNYNSTNKLIKVGRKTKDIFNKTFLKFERNKLKDCSIKKIKKNIQKLSESKKTNKMIKMKGYSEIKKVLDNCIKKKKKNYDDFKNNSLSTKRIIIKKKRDYDNIIRKMFSRPKETNEFLRYLKNTCFLNGKNDSLY